MTTVILLVLVLFSFFVLFSSGAQTPVEREQKGDARVNELVEAYAPQLTELRQILKGSPLLLQAKNLSRPMTEAELAYEGFPDYEDQWTSDGVLFTVPDSSSEVKGWVHDNQQTLAKMSSEFTTAKWLDFSGGLHAAVTRFN